MQEIKSKVKCPCTNHSLHECTKAKSNLEVTFQFSYCSLVWIFHRRCLNNKINSIHERALTITYQDNHRNLQVLATKMFKIRREFKRNICVQNKFVLSSQKHYVLKTSSALNQRTLAPLKIKNSVLFECSCRLCKTYIQQVGFL